MNNLSLIFTVILTCLGGIVSYGQSNINLDDYILDTIISVSEYDSTVVDTMIVARKKVVIKKEVIIENEIIVDPFLSNFTSNLWISPDWYTGKDYTFTKNNQTFTNTSKTGFSVGIDLVTDIKESFTCKGIVAYTQERNAQEVSILEITPTQTLHEYADTIEIFYIDNVPQYIIVQSSRTIYDTVFDTHSYAWNSKQHSLNIGIAIGKKIQVKTLQIIPSIGVCWQYIFKSDFTDSYKLYSETTQNTEMSIQSSMLKFGLSCDIHFPLVKNFGLVISPSYYIFSKKQNYTNSPFTGVCSINFGLFYTFL